MPELPYGSLPVPATPIWQLRAWQLEIQCSRCRRRTVVRLSDLADRYRRDTCVAEIVRRLQCDGFRGDDKCRAKPSRVKLVEVSSYGKSTRRLREVTVLD
jgi:hypothetical protein